MHEVVGVHPLPIRGRDSRPNPFHNLGAMVIVRREIGRKALIRFPVRLEAVGNELEEM